MIYVKGQLKMNKLYEVAKCSCVQMDETLLKNGGLLVEMLGQIKQKCNPCYFMMAKEPANQYLSSNGSEQPFSTFLIHRL